MKKFISVILSILLLSSCAAKPNRQSSISETEPTEQIVSQPTVGDGIIIPNIGVDVDSEIEAEGSVVFCDTNYYITDKSNYDNPGKHFSGTYDYSMLEGLSNIDIQIKNFLPEEQILKMMAGDSDVDIYFVTPSTVRRLKELGMYTVIDSDIIKDFNDGCFDYIKDFTLNENGETFLVPYSGSTKAVFYPQEAADEAGFTQEILSTYDGFVDFIRSYSGERKAFSLGMIMFWEFESQYEYYHCSYEDKSYDYTTDLYRKIYSFLDGWENNLPQGFSDLDQYSFRRHRKYNLLTFSSYQMFMRDLTMAENLCWNYDLYNNHKRVIDAPYILEEAKSWHAIPAPKISDKVEKGIADVEFMMINPHSKNKEAAVKVLETIAENYHDVFLEQMYMQFQVIRKDKSEYPERYSPDSTLFNDFYDIMANCVISTNSPQIYHYDADDFRAGKITMDEAIEEYARKVNIWLNE